MALDADHFKKTNAELCTRLEQAGSHSPQDVARVDRSTRVGGAFDFEGLEEQFRCAAELGDLRDQS